jgi:hypothetical protein
MARRVQVVALFEDRAHEFLLRSLLRRLGFSPHDVDYQRCEDCNRVERRFVDEVRSLRSKNYQHNIGILVMIDADAYGHAGRKRRLDGLLREAGLAERRATDRIAYVVPALEGENWYVHFCCPESRPIDETRDYKPSPEWRALRDDIGGAAGRLAAAWFPSLEDEPAAIRDARVELQRVRKPE